jgi:excisionase family DNA binding protein
MTVNDKVLFSRLEAAAALSISCVTLWRLVKAGKVRPTYVGSRQLFPATELQRFASAGESVHTAELVQR